MEQKFVLTSDQVRKLERAFARNDLQMRHFNWMLAGDNLRPVKWLAYGEIEPVVYKAKRDSEGRINLDTIKVGKGKDWAIAQQLAHDGSSQSNPRYRGEVDSTLGIAELAGLARCLVSPNDIDVAKFSYAHAETGLRNFALVEVTDPDFSGLCGPTDYFVQEKFRRMRIRPATFFELLSFGAHLRKIHKDDWYWSKTIVALGSSVATRRTMAQSGFFRTTLANFRRKLLRNPFRKAKPDTVNRYPCLECGAGRDFDTVLLTSCENGPWPAKTHLFLGVHL